MTMTETLKKTCALLTEIEPNPPHPTCPICGVQCRAYVGRRTKLAKVLHPMSATCFSFDDAPGQTFCREVFKK